MDEYIKNGKRSHYEIIKGAVEKVNVYASSVDLCIYVLDFDYPYNLYFQVKLKTSPGYAKYDVDEFLCYIKNLTDLEVEGQIVNDFPIYQLEKDKTKYSKK